MGKQLNLGLQRRTLLYVGCGLTLILGTFTVIAVRTIDRSADIMLHERLSFAKTVATEIDIRIEHIQAEMERHSKELALGRPTDSIDPMQAESLKSLHEHLAVFHRFVLPIGVAAVSASGDLLYASEGFDPGEESSLAQYLLSAAAGGKPMVVPEDGFLSSGILAMLFVAPIAREDGEILGVLATAVIPTLESPGFSLFAKQGSQDLELVAPDGRVVLGSSKDGTPNGTTHMTLMSDSLLLKQSGVRTHPSINSLGEEVDHIIAFAPLSDLSWSVIVEEKSDAALWLPQVLRKQVLLVAISALLLCLAAAWFATRAVALPLEKLTARCRRISSGDLETPVAIKGQDEVGALARSFEAMRIDLKESVERIQGWGKELEAKVKQRTKELEGRDQERDLLLRKILVAQEEERKRVARDLHDAVGQSLIALTFSAYAAQEAVANDSAKAAQNLKAMRSLIDSTTEEVRRLISDLRPSLLDDMGLLAALRWYAESRLEKAGVRAIVEAQGLDGRLASHVELAVFRVAQEAMNNTARHARASTAEVRLRVMEGKLMVLVSDDGIGFDPQEKRGDSAVGLLGMEERIIRAGGQFAVDSQVGKGTQVRFEVPYERQKESNGQDVNTHS